VETFLKEQTMFKSILIVGAAIAIALSANAALAQDRDRDIYGSQLMTQQERNEYRQRMQQAQTAQERERVRAEHHQRMLARAKERGVTLPDQPRAQPGRPMAPGGGAGPGGSRGR
jgi:hypothetical protein